MAAKLYNFLKHIHIVLLIGGMFFSIAWFEARLATIVEANENRDCIDHGKFNSSIDLLETQMDRQQIYLNFISNKLELLDTKIGKH